MAAIAITGGAIALYVLATRPAPAIVATTASAPIVLVARDAAASIPGPIEPARAERESAFQTLRRSGPADETWNPQAGAVFDSLKSSATLSDVGCYVVGCGATLTFRSDRTYRDALAQLETSAPYRAWTGGKQITSPDVQSDGRVVVALLLFRPD